MGNAQTFSIYYPNYAVCPPIMGIKPDYMQKFSSSLIKFSLIFTLTLSMSQISFAQCPGCIVALPTLPADTIYLTGAPDGEVFVSYNADLSFRLPITTTPVAAVDPTVPPGLPIDEFNITGVAGLPPGLDWEANQLEFVVSEETDGCVKICGTPIVSDSFFVEVQVDVVVFGITNAASFPVSIYIAPGVASNDGFSMSNNSGCGETTVEFTNNVPSNGNPDITYSWDFGNGEFSNQENPTPVTYDQPGTYVVEYEATIDTIGYILNEVTVEASGCDDIIGDPDFYIIISDPLGNDIYTSPVIDNTPAPVSFSVNIPLEPGNYSIEVRDDELIGDVGCGSVNFNQNTTGLLIDGDLEVSINILNPVSMVNTTDTVYVYEIPEAPVVGQPSVIPCEGTEIMLEITDNAYPENLQWYQDSIPLTGSTSDQLLVTEAGMYWVTYTSPDGCLATSNIVDVQYEAVPGDPVFTESDNVLSLEDAGALPASYTLYLYLDGTLIYSGEETEWCAEADGLYTLVVEDLITGCVAEWETDILINPEIDCTVSSEEILAEALKIWPNPFHDQIIVSLENAVTESVSLRLMSLDGKVLWQGFGNPGEKTEIGTSDLPAGFYLIQWQNASGQGVQKLIKQ
ncbi:MAG: T9SS type A sorting domain-containing protein [Bacteroidetes bacterium]|nr:T9SS type A sorting domain-containing protein [Bacteroidota bacterium]